VQPLVKDGKSLSGEAGFVKVTRGTGCTKKLLEKEAKKEPTC